MASPEKKTKTWVKVVVVILIMMMIFTTMIGALTPIIYGDELSDAKGELSDVNSEMKSLKSDLKSTEEKYKLTQQQLTELEDEMVTTQAEYDLVVYALGLAETEYNEKVAALNLVEEELATMENAEQNQEDLLQQRLRVMFMYSNMPYLDVLLSAQSYFEYLTLNDMVSSLLEYDMQVLDEIRLAKEEVEVKRLEAEEMKLEVEQRSLVIEGMKTEVEQKQATLTAQVAQQEKLSKDLKDQKAAIEEELETLEKESKELKELINKLAAAQGEYRGSGEMAWPVPSRKYVSSDYGMRVHPITGVYKMHTGIDIPAPKGTKIVSGAPGTVIYVSETKAYGKTVIVDHGGGITTLYAHMSKQTVKVGQEVEEGDKLGEVGTTGYSTGNHCHFEVRKNGSHVNPWNWVTNK